MTAGQVTAVVVCRHRAVLGGSRASLATHGPAPHGHEGCAPPLTRGSWQVAAASPFEDRVLAELEAGISLAGALLRLHDRHPDHELEVLVADGSQVAACGGALHLQDLGSGEYVVATTPEPGAGRPWTALPPGAVILLDPCGVTVTHPHPPIPESTR